MNVRFIDTSVMLNILDIPNMNSDAETIKKELQEAVDNEETLILPLATIIETGNHIAHIAGNRYHFATKFSECLKKTAEGSAPWELYGNELSKEDLYFLADSFPDSAAAETGIGDLSIIRAYENYKKKMPGIGRIMIWSTDQHLAGYCEQEVSVHRRRYK